MCICTATIGATPVPQRTGQGVDRGGSTMKGQGQGRRRRAYAGLAALVWAAAGTAGAQSLAEMLGTAIAADPAVTAASAQLRAAQERVVQAKAAFGPTAQIAASYVDTHYHEAPSFALRRFHDKQVALQLTQPLLRTALLPALDASQALQEQSVAQAAQSRAESAQRLVEAAFELLKARDTLVFAEAQRAATLEQLAQARRAFQVGTVAVTDVRDAEAKADTVAAQITVAQAELELRRELLAEVAGQPAPDFARRALAGDRLPPVEPAAVHGWLADAQAGNLAVRQAQRALEAAEAEVRKAWQAHAPTADLTASYTRSADTGTPTALLPRRANATALGVQINIPLFASGATQSRVAEAMALRDRAQADLDTAKRNVVIGVRQAFSNTLSAIGQARGLETAVRSQEIALRANRRGYEVGMKVNAEVLTAQSQLFEVRRDLSRARYDAWLNFAKLKAQAGRLDETDLAEIDGVLVGTPPTGLAAAGGTGADGATR